MKIFFLFIMFLNLLTLSFIGYQSSRAVVNDNEQIVITQNGKIVKSYTNPGEYFKLPIIQKTHYFTKTIQSVEFSHEAPTIDKVFVSLKILAYYRISDPILYYRNKLDSQSAKDMVRNTTEKATRKIVISEKVSNIVKEPTVELQKSTSSKCTSHMMPKIINIAKPELMKFGIEIVGIEAKCNILN